MLQIRGTMVNYLAEPTGIGSRDFCFSWKLDAGDARCVLQSSYSLVLWDDHGREIWSTANVSSDVENAEYAGPSLLPLHHYTWQVTSRVGEEEAVSERASFITGMCGAAFTARWISSPETRSVWNGVLLRKRFTLPAAVKSAILVSTAQGWYRPYINGSEISPDVFAPGWTVDSKRIAYQTYDVTDFIRPGEENVLAVSLGKGFSHNDFYNCFGKKEVSDEGMTRPGFFAELHLFEEDGSETVIPTDLTWEWAPSPITFAHLYMGEHYDARMADSAWALPESTLPWAPAGEGPETDAELFAALCPPARVMETIAPITLLTTPHGETVVDMGQNMVGWPEIRVIGEAGSKVRMRMFEVLDADGNVYTENLRSARTEVEYTLSGAEGGEIYKPSMTYFGFRYIHVQEWPGTPSLEDFRGLVVYAPMERTGKITTSDPTVNRLIENTLWGQKGNFVDVPTDCPQRDERLGWTGDAQVFCRTAAFNMNVDAFFSKWLADLAADQSPAGDVPFVVPNTFGEFRGSAAWGDAAVICPWTMYLCYGDKNLLRRQYPSMKGWVDHIVADGKDPWRWDEGFHFGDWLSLDVEHNSSTGSTDPYLIAQAMFVHSADLTMKAAAVLGFEEEAAHYEMVARNARKAFRDEYVTENGRLAVDTQTAYTLALHFDLVRPQDRPRVLRDLLAIVEKKNHHLATGFVGTPYLCHVLSREGHHEDAAKIFLQRDYPSWLYPVLHGATTIWERWDGICPDGSFQDAGMNSFNHYAYGSICDWIVQEAAGLDLDEKAPGYKHALLRPRYTPGLTDIHAEFESLYGRYVCGWTREENGLRVDVTVPVGATATLLLEHCDDLTAVTESGVPAVSRPEMKVTLHDNCAEIELGSGTYSFVY